MSGRSAEEAAARDTLSRITLQMTSSLKLDEVLHAITQGLVEEFGMALARIWLVMPDRQCPHCAAEGRGDESGSLHLAASAGITDRLDGTYHRVVVGALKIGGMAATREPFCANELLDDPRIPYTDWVLQHHL